MSKILFVHVPSIKEGELKEWEDKIQAKVKACGGDAEVCCVPNPDPKASFILQAELV